jgi:type II secretory pathway component GspD/PulD (secretin)
MKTWQLIGNATLAGSVVALALVLGGARGDEPDKPAANAPAAPGKPKLRVRVFPLTRSEPEAVLETLHTLFEGLAQREPPPAGVAGPRGGMAMMAGGPGGGMGGMMMPGGGGLGALGGLGLLGGAAGALPTGRAAHDPRTNALVVAGTEKDVALAADVVAALNAPADKPLPKLKHLRAYRLRFADPTELAQVLQQLELDASIVAGPQGSKLLFAAGPDDLLQDLDEAVKLLDAQGEKKAGGGPSQ